MQVLLLPVRCDALKKSGLAIPVYKDGLLTHPMENLEI